MPTTKSSPKDVFLHLLAIIALYVCAGSFISLVFDNINLFLPDALSPAYGAQGSMRGAMAALIIVFPVLLGASFIINREYKDDPKKRELTIRKWLLYFTLFVAAAAIIGDLVTLVYNFLEGDLTLRFVLKVAAVLAVAGTIFFYYTRDLRESWKPAQLRVFTGVISAVVLAAVVGGFFTAGSPFVARDERFDERRVSDLQIIQSEIINYWAQKDELPAALSGLQNDITGFRPPVDPQTSSSYEYRVVSKLSFELCANFTRDSAKQPYARMYPAGPYEQNWDHGAGRVCFSRTIDPQLYGKTGKPVPPVRE